MVWSVFVLEGARSGIAISQSTVGPTPVTRYAKPDADGPTVLVAHGFAGSRQIMQAYSLTLARAGYIAYAFDFEGHGRHPLPMSGDVTSIDGTTRKLVAQTRDVLASLDSSRPIALLGHSMATDILVRAATPDTGPLVLISAFSNEITPTAPDNLLLITGAWEPGLRDFAIEALQMVDPGAQDGDIATKDGLIRRAVIAPYVEHASILHSRVGERAALDWLDRYYDRTSTPSIPPTGWALLILLFGLVALFRPLASLLPDTNPPKPALSGKQLALLCALPALLAPLIAVPLDPGLLPVLVANYLALHLALFGAVQLVLMRLFKLPLGRFSAPAFALLLVWGLAVFGYALDRYGTNFWPNPERLLVIAALSLGAVPFMLADTALARYAGTWQRLLLRVAFLGSLGLAVALDFRALFFLIMIAPVIALFYGIFGLMGRFAARRAGPLAPGLALGLILAWALGVAFPLFAANGV